MASLSIRTIAPKTITTKNITAKDNNGEIGAKVPTERAR